MNNIDMREILDKVKGQSPILQILFVYMHVYPEMEIVDIIKSSKISAVGIEKHYNKIVKNNFFSIKPTLHGHKE